MSVSCYCARSIALMAVESCSKAILALCLGHGKSPCFLRLDFLKVFGVDGSVSVFASVDVEEFSECAFWHGKY
jgi:hypothetical protein